MSTIKIGSIITLGNYGGEPIEWIVFKRSDQGLRLLSNNAVDVIPEGMVHTYDWINSDVRKFLNTDFYNNAFNDFEKKAIVPYYYPALDGYGGDYADVVTLITNFERLEKNTLLRFCNTTPYAVSRGLHAYSRNKCNWAVRPAYYEKKGDPYPPTDWDAVNYGGRHHVNERVRANGGIGLRPSITVNPYLIP